MEGTATFAGTTPSSLKKVSGKKIKTTLGTEHIGKVSKKTPFRTKGMSSKRHKSK